MTPARSPKHQETIELATAKLAQQQEAKMNMTTAEAERFAVALHRLRRAERALDEN